MKNILFPFLSLILIAGVNAQVSTNEIAKLYFIEAEKQFNQTNWEEALKYISKTEKSLKSTNGRILNLKVKTLFNSGEFREAQASLDLFINNYSNSVTPELRNETMSYFIKLEKYFEKKGEEEKRIEKVRKEKEESLKYYTYESCSNYRCESGKIEESHSKKCYSCDGDGLKTKYDYVQAFANGLNGTNKNTSYTVKCSVCKGSGKINFTRKVKCNVCNGSAKVLGYVGSYDLSNEEVKDAISNHREKIDHFIRVKEAFSNNSELSFYPLKDFETNKIGFCDRDLNLSIPHKYGYAKIIEKDLAIVSKDEKSGVINSNGKIVIPLKYNELKKISNNSLLINEVYGDYFISDYKGKPKSTAFQDYLLLTGFYLVVQSESEYEILNFEGQIMDDAIYQDIIIINKNPFIIACQKLDEWKLLRLNKTIEDLYPESYAEIDSYKLNGKILILLKGEKTKLAKSDGSLVSNEEFEEIQINQDIGLVKLKKNQEYGFYDVSKDIMIYPKYTDLLLNKKFRNRIIVKKNEVFGVVNSYDKEIIEPMFYKIWFETGGKKFIAQRKEKSRKRYLYDLHGNYLGSYRE
ncbi:WG repeat-containing protein [Aquimarina algicola]|uniref:WG repeat-containing protein n=1 Tax=Aquimarina algicola TaxID=2589995 RepID=A0A504JF94_9FLAO|nr:WG repeat-containing protein [Aquimarina algicola]TPN87145.1 hypothetical protein FHK87_06015 [Aquimarina algicola]